MAFASGRTIFRRRRRPSRRRQSPSHRRDRSAEFVSRTQQLSRHIVQTLQIVHRVRPSVVFWRMRGCKSEMADDKHDKTSTRRADELEHLAQVSDRERDDRGREDEPERLRRVSRDGLIRARSFPPDVVVASRRPTPPARCVMIHRKGSDGAEPHEIVATVIVASPCRSYLTRWTTRSGRRRLPTAPDKAQKTAALTASAMTVCIRRTRFRSTNSSSTASRDSEFSSVRDACAGL